MADVAEKTYLGFTLTGIYTFLVCLVSFILILFFLHPSGDDKGKGKGKGKGKDGKDKDKDKDKGKEKGKGGFGKPTPEELVDALKKIGEKCGVEVAAEPDGFAELQRLHEEQLAAGPPAPPPAEGEEERPWYQFW